MGKRGLIGFLALATAGLALAAAGCGGSSSSSSSGGGGGATGAAATGAAAGGGATTESGGGGNVSNIQALPSSSCGPVEYKGDGQPDVLIASDLPLQGSSRTQTEQMVAGIRYVLDQAGWKAGDTKVAYQSCDDATAQAAKWDPSKCNQNAHTYAGNSDLVGVIGTFNSGCAAIEIPILNQAPGGGLLLVSPANTYVCLTTTAPACDTTEPDKYYPSGTRNYARDVAHDAYQAAADTQFMKDIGVTSVYVLNDKEAYGLGLADNLKGALAAAGVKLAGFEAWDPKASSYEALMEKVKSSGANAVFVAGIVDNNGAKLIKDKVSVLGPNVSDPSQGVVLVGPDGFTEQGTIDEAGAASQDMYSSVAGEPADKLTGKGKEFISGFESAAGTTNVQPYTAYAAQAAQIVLNAIAASDGSRSGVIDQVFGMKIQDGILGTFSITDDGDPTVGPVTVYKASKTFEPFKVITPPANLVKAALSG